MKYLVTGRPRSRTAWLAALLYSDDLPTLHDDLEAYRDLELQGKPYGLFGHAQLVLDPVNLLGRFQGCPIAIIDRDEESSRAALERRYGGPAQSWERIEQPYRWFVENVDPAYTLRVPVGALDQYDVADRVSRHCTGKALPRSRFDLFYGLKIEQFSEKLFGG